MHTIDKAADMLKGWVCRAADDLYICPDRPDLVCYGAGYNGWGMQTHQKALAAFAVAGERETALKMLRFMLETHIEGSYACLDGNQWGHTWISALGTERAMHAVEALLPHMDEADKSLLEKVMLSEADWLTDHYEIVGAPDDASGKNKPESNIWNGAFLHRAAAMYPDCPRAGEYKAKGTAFLVNGISLPGDSRSGKVLDGRTVAGWHAGANFYDTYALDHHGYLNVGYMVICLSNLAMWHFSCKKAGCAPTQAVYHNALGLWRLVKSMLAEDGRLLRIGGDTRARYCYCQDYLLPALLFARDALGDRDASKYEERLAGLFHKEFTANGDGSFLSGRLGRLKEISPIYYTRLESDKACVLSMLLHWNSLAGTGESSAAPLTSWRAPSHGACMVRGEKRFASWAFRGAEGMTGLILPPQRGDFAEWRDNLAGEIRGSGNRSGTEVLSHEEALFGGGFFVCGEVNRIARGFLAEQQKNEVVAKEHIVFAALPDGATVVAMQYAAAPGRRFLQSVKGIHYNVPNDVYNDFARVYYGGNGVLEAGKFAGAEECIDLGGSWVNVDNQLGVIAAYPNESLRLYRPGRRQVVCGNRAADRNADYTASLSCDVVCTRLETKPRWADKGAVLLDTAAILVTGTAEETKKIAAFSPPHIGIEADAVIRKVVAPGADGRIYIVLSNPSEADRIVKFHAGRAVCDVLTGQAARDTVVPAKGGGLFRA